MSERCRLPRSLRRNNRGGLSRRRQRLAHHHQSPVNIVESIVSAATSRFVSRFPLRPFDAFRRRRLAGSFVAAAGASEVPDTAATGAGPDNAKGCLLMMSPSPFSAAGSVGEAVV